MSWSLFCTCKYIIWLANMRAEPQKPLWRLHLILIILIKWRKLPKNFWNHHKFGHMQLLHYFSISQMIDIFLSSSKNLISPKICEDNMYFWNVTYFIFNKNSCRNNCSYGWECIYHFCCNSSANILYRINFSLSIGICTLYK